MTGLFFQSKVLRYGTAVVVTMLFLLCGSACQKEPGIGGTGAIQGTIIEKFFNDDYSEFLYDRPAVDEEIFILFGNDRVVGDRVFTGITGEFRFEFLYPGSYEIYFQSDDTSAVVENDWGARHQVEVSRGQEVSLGELEKITALDFDDGAAVIKGVVWEVNYVNESRWPDLVVESEDYAYEQEVYLTYGNHTFYDERVRTQHGGYFEFSNLIPGDYLVFLYSEDVKRLTDKVVLEFEVTISEFDQVVDLGQITVEKR